MARVKICGITNLEDAKAAVDLGADALGFNFFPESPRYISPESAAEVINRTPATVWFVGVFVNETRARVEEIASSVGLDTLQFHGDETVEYCSSWGSLRIVKAIRVGSSEDFELVHQFNQSVDHLLFDSRDPGLYGGSGKEISNELLQNKEIASVFTSSFLAGGLTPQNVADKIDRFSPFGVDVASGVEIAPGKKSFQQMKDFIRAVK